MGPVSPQGKAFLEGTAEFKPGAAPGVPWPVSHTPRKLKCSDPGSASLSSSVYPPTHTHTSLQPAPLIIRDSTGSASPLLHQAAVPLSLQKPCPSHRDLHEARSLSRVARAGCLSRATH